MSRLTRFFKSISNAGREKKAVALLYSDLKTPILTAKGRMGGLGNYRIRAKKWCACGRGSILAETLSYLELNQEIPEEVFQSVAVIYPGYWVKGKQPD